MDVAHEYLLRKRRRACVIVSPPLVISSEESQGCLLEGAGMGTAISRRVNNKGSHKTMVRQAAIKQVGRMQWWTCEVVDVCGGARHRQPAVCLRRKSQG